MNSFSAQSSCSNSRLLQVNIYRARNAADDGEVEVRFRLKEVETASVPNLAQLKETMKFCLNASEEEGEKAKVFFKNAKKMLEQKHLPVLEVSEQNTTGIKGPPINGTPFYAFMKATGQSKKESETATGSYGIGKFAPYAVSDLRTVFVSTVYKDEDGEWHQLTQGKSVLMSHDKGEERRRGIGFWGVMEKCRPIDGVDPTLDGWIQRASKKSATSRYARYRSFLRASSCGKALLVLVTFRNCRRRFPTALVV
jgi:hypothetical protein